MIEKINKIPHQVVFRGVNIKSNVKKTCANSNILNPTCKREYGMYTKQIGVLAIGLAIISPFVLLYGICKGIAKCLEHAESIKAKKNC